MTDNPTPHPNPWANRIPRTATDWVDHDLHYAQQHFEWTSDHIKELLDGDRAAHNRNIRLEIAGWVNVYLWEVVRRYAPEIADRVAEDIADACEAGDSMGEWLWDWQQDRARGKGLRLPFELAKP